MAYKTATKQGWTAAVAHARHVPPVQMAYKTATKQGWTAEAVVSLAIPGQGATPFQDIISKVAGTDGQVGQWIQKGTKGIIHGKVITR